MAMIKCPKCGEGISDKSTTCIHCGHVLIEESKVFCEECGAEIEKNEEICSKCGCHEGNRKPDGRICGVSCTVPSEYSDRCEDRGRKVG